MTDIEKPNIILLFVDQMRGDAFAADGNPVIQTPNLDFLASHGTRFKHAYTAVPSCLPARSTLMTGLNQWHAGVLGMGGGQGPVPNDFPHTLAGTFTDSGYRTHLVGKGHFEPQRTSMGFQSSELDESGRMPDSEHRQWFAQHASAGMTPDDHGVGFNSWHARPWHTDEHLHPSAWTMQRSLSFLEDHDRDTPFFLNISFARPHSPYVPPEHYFNRYYNGETPKPHIGEWSAMHDDPQTAALPDAWRGKMTDQQIHNARSGYYGSISFIDSQVGRLLNYLQKDEKLSRNTWILFSADHGDMQGDHHLWRKTYAYEGSTRIPFILCPPCRGARAQRKVSDEVVELRDVMPTLLDIAGLKGPEYMDGSSCLPLSSDKANEWRPYIHGEHSTCYHPDQEMQYVTDGRRKFIWLPRIGVEQFFNLENDPGECENLIDIPVYADEIQQWRQYLIDELTERACGWVQDGQLHCPGSEFLVSPWKEERYTG
ncbi:MAG: arylsulfatase [Planctomycetes bacterium]|nr:arylsulfatase [Planctomycetota bacterium]